MLSNNDLIHFVDDYLLDFIVQRIEHELPSGETWYCNACDAEAATPEQIEHGADCVVAKWAMLKLHFKPVKVIKVLDGIGIDYAPVGDMQATYCCGQVFVTWMNYRLHREEKHGS